MIPATRDISVTSTLQPKETIKLGIDPNNERQFMAMLSAIYSDEQAAIIREYVTNALDSHIEAGQTRPIEVSAPGRLSPFFIVKDFGVGLSMDDLRDVYALYGASTKRFTQDQAGSLGIGAKSALAYAGQFTVTSVKNGEKVVAIISLDDDEAGTMDILSVTKTDEHNGVTINIPVNKDHVGFNEKLNKMHSFMEPGLMLVDDKDADRSHINALSDTFSMYGDGYSDDIVVMGNVAYPVDRYVYGRIYRNFSVIIRVKMGEVMFTPSREELNYTQKTRETLNAYQQEFEENLIKYMQRTIDECESKRLAYNTQNKLLGRLDYHLRSNPFQYKGVDLPLPNKTATGTGVYVTRVTWGLNGRSYCRTKSACQLNSIEQDTVFIKNFNNVKFTKTQALKIEKFFENKGQNVLAKAAVLMHSAFDGHGLFDDVTVYDYEADIKPVKVSTGGSSNGIKARGAKREYLVTGGGVGHRLAVPNASINLWYASKSELRQGVYTDWLDVSKEFNTATDQLVFVADREQKAFLKNYPSAKHYKGFYVSLVDDAINSITSEEYAAVKYSAQIPNSNSLIASEVLDQELKMYLNSAEKPTTDYLWEVKTKINKVRDLIYKLPYGTATGYLDKLPSQDRQASDSVTGKYPLLKEISYWGAPSHDLRRLLTDYVNTVYTRTTQQKEA